MRLIKRLWAVLLAGLLLVGLLVGFGDDDEAIAKEPRATIGKMMIPAAAFVPNADGTDHVNNGWHVFTSGTTGYFHATLSFPVPEVYIRKIMLLAHDTGAGQACISPQKAQPLKATEALIGTSLCTVDSTDNPQRRVLTTFYSPRVNTANHGAFLQLNLDPGILFYGVQVAYSY